MTEALMQSMMTADLSEWNSYMKDTNVDEVFKPGSEFTWNDSDDPDDSVTLHGEDFDIDEKLDIVEEELVDLTPENSGEPLNKLLR